MPATTLTNAWSQTDYTAQFDHHKNNSTGGSNLGALPATASGSITWSNSHFKGAVQLTYPNPLPNATLDHSGFFTAFRFAQKIPVQVVIQGNFQVVANPKDPGPLVFILHSNFYQSADCPDPADQRISVKDGATVPVNVTRTCNISTLLLDSATSAHIEFSFDYELATTDGRADFGFDYDGFDVQSFYTFKEAAPPQDLGVDEFTPDECPICDSCSINSARSTSPQAATTATFSKHLRAVAGSTTPAQGTAPMKCVNLATPGGACSLDYTITLDPSNPPWFNIGSTPLKGTVTNTTSVAITVTGDASKLGPGTYTAKFTVNAACATCPRTEIVVFDVQASCQTLSFVPGSITPDPTLGLDWSMTHGFQASVAYQLDTVSEADLSLRLYDGTGAGRTLLGASNFTRVHRSDGAAKAALSIDPVDLGQELSEVYLTASLINPATAGTIAEITPAVKFQIAPSLTPVVEVVQSVQSSGNGAALVKGRPTVIRVYARQRGATDFPISGITATVNARLLTDTGAGPLLGGSPILLSGPIAALIDLTAPLADDRDKVNRSLNFKLPDPWMSAPPAGATSPLYQFEVQLQPPPDRPVADKSQLKDNTLVNFNASDPLHIRYFPFCYLSKANCPTNGIGGAAEFLKKVFPLSGPVDYRAVDPPADPWPFRLSDPDPKNADLPLRRLIVYLDGYFNTLLADHKIEPDAKLVAWLPDLALRDTKTVIGKSDPLFLRGHGRVAWILDLALDAETQATSQRTLAHETGHNLGLHHTNLSTSVCDRSSDPGTDWPWPDDTIHDPGFDTLALPLPTFKNGSRFDLMGYCPAASTWISVYHWNQLQSALATPVVTGSSFGTPAKRRTDAAASDLLLVSGMVQRDGSAGALDPTYRVTGGLAVDQSDPAGRYCLRFSNASGPLGDSCFSPAFQTPDTAGLLDQDYFSLVVPYVAGATRLGLVYLDAAGGARELAALNGGGSPPAVTITLPQPGTTLGGASATIAWTAADPAGLPLTYAVQYSNDGGQTFAPLSLSLTATSYSVDLSKIRGGDQVYFRVLAMNGLETTRASVGPMVAPQSPQLAVAASSLSFGNVQAGLQSAQPLALNNTGTGPLTIRSLAFNQGAFTTDTPLPLDIWPGSPQTINVEFAPSTTGTVSGSLTVNGTSAVQLQGVGFDHAVPSIVPPAKLDFASVNTGQTKDLTIAIGNNGNAPLSVTSLLSSIAAYKITAPALPFSVAAGEATVVTVRFAPAAAGAQPGTLSIVTNDPSRSSLAVSITGTGVGAASAPAIGVPASLDFGSVTVGQAKTVPLTIGNTGGASLSVTGLTGLAAPFAATAALPLAVAAGGQQTINVTFTPTAAGAAKATLNIASNDPARSILPVSITGTGAAAATAPAIGVTPLLLAFGAVTVGQAKDLPLTIANKGTAPLVVGSTTSDNPQFAPVGISPPVAPGASVTLTVRFTPTSATAQTGNLSILSNDPAAPNTKIALTGTGAAAAGGDKILSVDGGSFKGLLGYPQGLDAAVFVNRLTPPTYPATLKAVQIYFGNRTNGLPAGTPILLVAATLPGTVPEGVTTISASSAGVLNETLATVGTPGAFTTYTLAQPITIVSGDFVVGFVASNPAGVYPADVDNTTPSQRRSYTSGDAQTFTLIDSFGYVGNLGIRAVVTTQ